jgi:hypothetical protein
VQIGWPRPFVSTEPKMLGGEQMLLPLPCSAESRDDFLSMSLWVEDAYRKHLCGVCGEPLRATTCMGIVKNPSDYLSNGPPVHPRCMALSLRFCPHFDLRYSQDEPIAFIYTGTDAGYARNAESEELLHVDRAAIQATRTDIVALAKSDPLGHGVYQ